MIKEWTSYKIIKGKLYQINYCEWDYYGGSKILSNDMVEINESNCKDYKRLYKEALRQNGG